MKISRERKNRNNQVYRRERQAYAMMRLFLPVLLIFLFSLTVYAGDIEIKLGYGYRDIAKSGQLLPVTVSFENASAETVDGFMSVEIAGENGTVSYTSTVTIPPEGQTVKRTVTIPDAYSRPEGDRITVRLFDDSGAEICSAQTEVTYLGSGKEVFIGILSDDQPALDYLGNLSISEQYSTRTIMLNPTDLPEEADGLNQLDLIVISSFDMSRLSEKVIAAVMDWVEDGGILLIGTGASTQPLGGFRRYLGSCSLSGALYTTVNMGMKYSKSGPDDALVRIPIRRIDWAGAALVPTEADRDLFWKRFFEKGSICIAGCDLCDLSGFSGEHPGFAQDLVLDILGQTGLSRISAGLSSSEERLEAAERLTNTFREDKIPKVRIYAVFAVAFVFATGSVLFRVLKNRGLGMYYMLGVLILSSGGALLCWLLSSSTRIIHPFIDYGVISEYTVHSAAESDPQNAQISHKAVEKGFLNIESPNLSALTLELSESCSVRPVYISGNSSLTEGKKQMLAVTGQKQFEKNIFQVEEKPAQVDGRAPLSVIFEAAENGVRGTVSNTGDTAFTSLSLITDRFAVRLGDLKPGEEVSFDETDLIYGPMAKPEVSSGYLLTGTKEEYPDQKISLIDYELSESIALEEGKALLLGFASAYTPGFLPSTRYTLQGSTMIAVEAERVDSGEGSFVTEFGKSPEVLSGTYSRRDNTIQGNADTILEFSVGGAYEVESLEMHELSEILSGASVTAFRGQTSFYNYENGRFDLIDAGKLTFTKEELSVYLSPTNSLIARFTPDEEKNTAVPMFLPVLYVKVKPVRSAVISAPTM